MIIKLIRLLDGSGCAMLDDKLLKRLARGAARLRRLNLASLLRISPKGPSFRLLSTIESENKYYLLRYRIGRVVEGMCVSRFAWHCWLRFAQWLWYLKETYICYWNLLNRGWWSVDIDVAAQSNDVIIVAFVAHRTLATWRSSTLLDSITFEHFRIDKFKKYICNSLRIWICRIVHRWVPMRWLPSSNNAGTVCERVCRKTTFIFTDHIFHLQIVRGCSR